MLRLKQVSCERVLLETKTLRAAILAATLNTLHRSNDRRANKLLAEGRKTDAFARWNC